MATKAVLIFLAFAVVSDYAATIWPPAKEVSHMWSGLDDRPQTVQVQP